MGDMGEVFKVMKEDDLGLTRDDNPDIERDLT